MGMLSRYGDSTRACRRRSRCHLIWRFEQKCPLGIAYAATDHALVAPAADGAFTDPHAGSELADGEHVADGAMCLRD